MSLRPTVRLTDLYEPIIEFLTKNQLQGYTQSFIVAGCCTVEGAMLLTEASLTTAPFLMQSHHVRHLLNALAKEKQKEKQKKTIHNN